jgi:hypothetical protein
MTTLLRWLTGKEKEAPPAQSQIGTTPMTSYWVEGAVPHGLEASGYVEADGWEIPAWQINIYRALRGLGWDHDMAYAGLQFASPLADEGITDENTLLRRALRVGD